MLTYRKNTAIIEINLDWRLIVAGSLPIPDISDIGDWHYAARAAARRALRAGESAREAVESAIDAIADSLADNGDQWPAGGVRARLVRAR